MGDGQVLYGKLGRNILNYLLAAGETLPNNCYLCEEGRKRATGWKADVHPCLPDTLFGLQCPSLLSDASARCSMLPQRRVTFWFPLPRGRKKAVKEELNISKEACEHVWGLRIYRLDPPMCLGRDSKWWHPMHSE